MRMEEKSLFCHYFETMTESKGSKQNHHVYIPEVALIEFDESKFYSPTECLNWLRSSEWSSLVDRKNFRIRHKKKLQFLASEARAGWAFSAFTKFKTLMCVRPTPYIIVITGHGEKSMAEELPPLRPVDLEKMELEELKRKQKEERRKEVLAKARKERREISDEVEKLMGSIETSKWTKDEIKAKKESFRKALQNDLKKKKKEGTTEKVNEPEKKHIKKEVESSDDESSKSKKRKKEVSRKALIKRRFSQEYPPNQEQYMAEKDLEKVDIVD